MLKAETHCLHDLSSLITSTRVWQEAQENRKHVAAMLLAIVEELKEVGITTEKRFEALLAKHLSEVDQVVAEGEDQAKANFPGGADRDSG